MFLDNEFSWSVSRDAIFKSCRRRYYYHYYGSWGGWSLDAENKTRTTYILKQLKNRQMWAGAKVHESIEYVLKSLQEGVDIDLDTVIEDTLDRMRGEFKNSLSRMYLLEPKTCALFEHEYGIPVADIEWKKNSKHVADCLRHFFKSKIYEDITRLSQDQWLEVEKFSSFYEKGIKIYSVFDFACQKNQEVFIYDWKTGKDDHGPHKLQLACYGLFATKKWDICADQVQMKEFNLSSGKVFDMSLDDVNLELIQRQIWDSIETMLGCLEDRQTNSAVEERFALAENRDICVHCNYLKICPQ